MNILLVSAYFPPEVGSAAHLFADIGSELVRRGHTVTVLTSYPAYNVAQNDLSPKYKNGMLLKERSRGMDVIRVRSFRMPRDIPVLRGVDQVLMALLFLVAGLFNVPNVDVVLVYSPPLFLGLTGLLIASYRRTGVILNVQDLFPQSAIDLGILRNKSLIKLFRLAEKFLYRRVDAVTVHSAGNREHVLHCGGSPDSTCIVPNVIDVDELKPGPRQNAFRDRYRIGSSEFVVSFAGVLGYSQDLDTVIEAARLMKSTPDLVFYIVGDGVEKKRLIEKADDMTNVRFLPMLQKSEYNELLSASDICLVTLRKVVKTPVVPSKILSIMAAERPVIAAVPAHGDAPKLIRESQCGICVEPEDPAALEAAIRNMMSDREQSSKYGHNGRQYAEKYLSLSACVSSYEEIFGKHRHRE